MDFGARQLAGMAFSRRFTTHLMPLVILGDLASHGAPELKAEAAMLAADSICSFDNRRRGDVLADMPAAMSKPDAEIARFVARLVPGQVCRGTKS